MNGEFEMQRHWCHCCRREFLLDLRRNQFVCSSCNSELIEEMSADHPEEFILEQPRVPGMRVHSTVIVSPFSTLIITQVISSGRIVRMEDLVELISRNNPDSNGAPPAQEEEIKQLETPKEHQAGSECAICKEELKPDAVLKKMPCQHVFHGKCLENWLKIHNTCPVCRYSLGNHNPR